MFLEDSTVENIMEEVRGLDIGSDEALAIFVGEKSTFPIQELVEELDAANTSFFGGIFPGLIYKDRRYEEGIVMTKLPLLHSPILVKGISQGEYQLPSMDTLLGEDQEKKIAMILVDGLISNIASFLSAMYSHLGNTISYFGGGAGSLSLVQKPCLFCNEGIFQDAALVTLIDSQMAIGVRHGWQQIMGPYVATKTDNTRVLELNWRKAFDLYQEIVENDSGEPLTKENFFDIAKGYPFGMKKDYAECIVRDPIAVGEEDDLICVGEVPENSVLEILKGDKDSLVEAAKMAANDCKEAEEKGISHGLVVDCISRVLFLEEHFNEELKAVSESLATIDEGLVGEGILSLGEIASYGDGFLEFFNKTIVVGVLHK